MLYAYRITYANEEYTIYAGYEGTDPSARRFKFIIPVADAAAQNDLINEFSKFFSCTPETVNNEIVYLYSDIQPAQLNDFKQFLTTRGRRDIPVEAPPLRNNKCIDWGTADDLITELAHAAPYQINLLNPLAPQNNGSNDRKEQPAAPIVAKAAETPFLSAKEWVVLITAILLFIAFSFSAAVSIAAFLGDTNVLGVFTHHFKLPSTSVASSLGSTILGAIAGGSGLLALAIAITMAIYLLAKKVNPDGDSSPTFNKVMAATFLILGVLATSVLLGFSAAALAGSTIAIHFLTDTLHLIDGMASLDSNMLLGAISAIAIAVIVCSIVATIYFARKAVTAEENILNISSPHMGDNILLEYSLAESSIGGGIADYFNDAVDFMYDLFTPNNTQTVSAPVIAAPMPTAADRDWDDTTDVSTESCGCLSWIRHALSPPSPHHYPSAENGGVRNEHYYEITY